MLFLIVALVATAILTWKLSWSNGWYGQRYYDGFGTFVGLMSGLVLVALSILPQGIIWSANSGGGGSEWALRSTTQLASIDDGQGVRGSFSGFLFVSGSLNSTAQYSWYLKVNDAYYLRSIDSNYVKVYQDATPTTARVECWAWRQTTQPSIWLTLVERPKWSTKVDQYDGEQCHEWVVHVPPHSIKQGYNLNGANQ